VCTAIACRRPPLPTRTPKSTCRDDTNVTPLWLWECLHITTLTVLMISKMISKLGSWNQDRGVLV